MQARQETVEGHEDWRHGLDAALSEAGGQAAAAFDDLVGQVGVLRGLVAEPRENPAEAARARYGAWLDGLAPSDWTLAARRALDALGPAPDAPWPAFAAARTAAEEAISEVRTARRRLTGPAQSGDAVMQRLDHVRIALADATERPAGETAAVARVGARLIDGLADDMHGSVAEIRTALADMQGGLDRLDSVLAALSGQPPALPASLDPGGAPELAEDAAAEGAAAFAALAGARRPAAAVACGLFDPDRIPGAAEAIAAAAGPLSDRIAAAADSLRPIAVPLAARSHGAPVPPDALAWLESLYTMEEERVLHRAALAAPPEGAPDEAAVEPRPAPLAALRQRAAEARARVVRIAAAVVRIVRDPRFTLAVLLGLTLLAAGATIILGSGRVPTPAVVALLLGQSLGAFAAASFVLVRSERRFEATRADFERMAFRDPLTDLLNRRGLTRLLDERMCRGTAEVAALHIDLDHFKSVNDTLGHDAGDHVLTVTTRRMTGIVNGHGEVCRIGGDEFCVVLFGESAADAERIAGEIVAVAREPIDFEGNLCAIGASIGIATSGAATGRVAPERLLTDADLATFVAKSEGRGRYAFFDVKLREEMEREAQLATGLRRAIEESALEVWFQPVMDLSGMHVLSAEALLRWRDPVLGDVAPETLLPVAERHNLLDRVQDRVLDETLRAVRDWRARGLSLPLVTVNLGRTELRRQDLADRIRFALDRADCPPEAFGVEVTERSCGGRGAQIARETLTALRGCGVSVIVDRFGRDEVSLAALTAIRANAVKLDRGLVGQLGHDGDSGALLKGLVSLSRSLGLGITASGVETSEQLRALRGVGCDGLQGHAVARPQPADSFAEWLDFMAPAAAGRGA